MFMDYSKGILTDLTLLGPDNRLVGKFQEVLGQNYIADLFDKGFVLFHGVSLTGNRHSFEQGVRCVGY